MVVQLNISNEQNGFGPFEAMKFTGTRENYEEVEKFVGKLPSGYDVIAGATAWYAKNGESGIGPIWIHSFSGIEEVESGDWVIRSIGKSKAIFSMKHFIFNALFNTNNMNG